MVQCSASGVIMHLTEIMCDRAGVANAVSGIISNFGSTLPDTTARESHKNVTVADEAVPEIAFNGTLEKGGDTSVLSMTDNTEVCWTTSNKNVVMLEQNTEENSISTNALTDSVIGNSVKAMVVGPGNATITAETATGIKHTQEVKVEDGENSRRSPDRRNQTQGWRKNYQSAV